MVDTRIGDGFFPNDVKAAPLKIEDEFASVRVRALDERSALRARLAKLDELLGDASVAHNGLNGSAPKVPDVPSSASMPTKPSSPKPKAGVTESVVAYLRNLNSGDGVSAKDLAANTGHDPIAVSNTLNRLKKAGRVTSKGGKRDMKWYNNE